MSLFLHISIILLVHICMHAICVRLLPDSSDDSRLMKERSQCHFDLMILLPHKHYSHESRIFISSVRHCHWVRLAESVNSAIEL